MQFIIKTTTRCNFRCVYCSEGDQPPQDLPLALFEKLVDEIPTILPDGEQHVNILWHGGEPLLWGRERLAGAMRYAEEHLPGVQVTFSLQTNGYLLDEAWLALFAAHHVRVGVSLDGSRELQDAHRPLRDGSPTFDVVWQNVQRLRQAQLGGSILMVVDTAEPIDAEKLFAFLAAHRLPCKINPLIPCGRADGMDVQQIYAAYVDLLIALDRLSMASESDVPIAPIDQLLDTIVGGGSVQSCCYNGACAKHLVCLYADGNVGICGRDAGTESLVYGSLAEHPLSELYHGAIANELRTRGAYLAAHDCKGCTAWPFCRGGCTFAAFHAHGTWRAPFPVCKEYQRLVAFLRTEGLDLLRARLVRKKRAYRQRLAARRRLLEEVRQHARQ